ncbi:Putative callose synthase 8 [Morus notabilis]|uniref:1,3-beta-glucan synthase n=1 Tax=Morus notabilis TaxID=981085 RepID=W9S5R0_9ROSA|nr:Putative callose synthase 8 [Morus notabilis]
MSHEIVVAEPIFYECEPELPKPASSSSITVSSEIVLDQQQQHQSVPEPFDSERLPQTVAAEIQRFLRVANLVEIDEPRVAFLCRVHAFEIAHNMDKNSSGRGVRQFKTSLLQRLEQDEEPTFRRRKEKSDIRELRRVYHEYKEYIVKHGRTFALESRQKLINACAIASVLFEVLKRITFAANPQALADRESVNSKSEFFVPYNILPLDHGGIQQAIMQLPEVKAAVAAVRNIRGLPSAEDFQKHGAFTDLFDFLQYCFGFQEGNVANQREHLILLLANTHIRKAHKQTSSSKIEDVVVDELMKKFFKNYTNWCKFLGRKSNIRLPYVKQEALQYKLLYLALHLLIWGEAANLRFMPECLCYIFHEMAWELHGMLTGAVNPTTWEKVMPAYGGGSESFLNNVVTPIYKVIKEEANKSKNGTTDHSTWRNYDDLNEFFWSPDCFQIGWPMREDHNFFCVNPSSKPKAKKASKSTNAEEKRELKEEEKDEELGTNREGDQEQKHEQEWLGKSNFVEIRSFWQIFRSFDRMWIFFILSLQAMIIMACYELESPLQLFDKAVFEDVLSIFITSSILKLIQVGVYLTPSAIDMVLFFVPAVRKYIEISNSKIFTIFSWTQIIPRKRDARKPGLSAEVYFMDTQIWYSVFCTIFGGLYGILHHLGEWSYNDMSQIRTLGMLRSRFHTLPSAFNGCLIPPSKNDQKRGKGLFGNRFHKGPENEKNGVAKFVLVWNQIISSIRSEDLISNKEVDLMIIPMLTDLFAGIVRWPIFLIANKFSTALSITKDFVGKDETLVRKIKKDKCMYYAVKECYESLKYILEILIVRDLEKRMISTILNEIEESMARSSLLEDFRMTELPNLQAKFVELLELLVEGNVDHYGKVVKVLQDIFEIITNDMMIDSSRILELLCHSQRMESNEPYFTRTIEPQLFESDCGENSIHFPLPDSAPLTEQIKRLLLLLTIKDTALDIPTNLDARRRISFFATSLFMTMPSAPKVRNMLSFSVLTPHYMEDVNFSMKELHSSQREVSIIFYMQKIFPDEWKNFLERMGCASLDGLKDEGKEEDLRKWASFRGQTLSRTVRGMMYYREALKLQAFLDMAEDEDILEGYDTAERENHLLAAQLDALADLKFTYVVSCQRFGSQKAAGDPRAQDIIDLMIRYPALRLAYVEEKEVIVENKPQKVYSSVLLKAVNGFDQEIYRVKLPGPPEIGEGKPENQNHAIIFTRGEALQTIDMNQDSYLEEAFKMRNLLQEFLKCQGRRPPTILGLREHIFTESVSSLAWFMSYQETSFVTIGQRLLAKPLRVRFHYGHPDIFDRIFHITRGGISKASKTINLSEDIFAGFNSTLRRGCITYHEYMQVGKGRDVGLNQISKFEAKVANGNSEQTLSRDIYRLGCQFDFFRMLSCYFTTIGFYFSSLISIIGIYIFLYGQLYLVLSGLQKALLIEARVQNLESLETALASQSFIQLGLLTGLPMVMEIGLEKGFLTALKDFVLMQLQLAAVFFTFSFGTKTHHYGRTLLHGGAKYRPTGRKVVVFHTSFTENYRLYSRSHFVKGFELLLLLIVYDLFRRSYESSMAYVLITYSVWFMSITWLFAPFLFNPSGFSWGKIVDDWKDWNKWIRQQGGIGIQQDKSWHSWWNDEQAHLRHSGIFSRLFEILLSLRFFMYQYGLVYHLDISQHSKNVLVYVLSWIVILVVFFFAKAVNIGRQKLSANYQLLFRLFKAILFITVLAIIITLSRICQLSLRDLIVCCLAFLPTGWGLIMIAQAVRPKIEDTGLWDFTRVLAKAYDYGMGVVLFAPIAILAWLPIISAFQTRFLFNEAFNRHLQIQPILAGKRKQK